jgi:hypothetical protein
MLPETKESTFFHVLANSLWIKASQILEKFPEILCLNLVFLSENFLLDALAGIKKKKDFVLK